MKTKISHRHHGHTIYLDVYPWLGVRMIPKFLGYLPTNPFLGSFRTGCFANTPATCVRILYCFECEEVTRGIDTPLTTISSTCGSDVFIIFYELDVEITLDGEVNCAMHPWSVSHFHNVIHEEFNIVMAPPCNVDGSMSYGLDELLYEIGFTIMAK